MTWSTTGIAKLMFLNFHSYKVWGDFGNGPWTPCYPHSMCGCQLQGGGIINIWKRPHIMSAWLQKAFMDKLKFGCWQTKLYLKQHEKRKWVQFPVTCVLSVDTIKYQPPCFVKGNGGHWDPTITYSLLWSNPYNLSLMKPISAFLKYYKIKLLYIL